MKKRKDCIFILSTGCLRVAKLSNQSSISGSNTHLSTARTSSQKLKFISADDATGEYCVRNSPNSIQSIRFTYAYFDQSQATRIESFE